MNTLPSGKYWIGDPCYVMGHDDNKFNWGEFCSFCFKDDPTGRKNEGIVTHQGITFAYFGTAYGDGRYLDQFGNEYGVDAGMIGCIPVDSVIDKEGLGLGTVHEFKGSFIAEYDNGIIWFGNVEIPTDGSDDEDYDPYENDDDDEDYDPYENDDDDENID